VELAGAPRVHFALDVELEFWKRSGRRIDYSRSSGEEYGEFKSYHLTSRHHRSRIWDQWWLYRCDDRCGTDCGNDCSLRAKSDRKRDWKVTVTSTATNSPNSVSVTGTGISSNFPFCDTQLDGEQQYGSGWLLRVQVNDSGLRIASQFVAFFGDKYTDGTVGSGTTYYYVVTAVNSSGTESAKSGK